VEQREERSMSIPPSNTIKAAGGKPIRVRWWDSATQAAGAVKRLTTAADSYGMHGSEAGLERGLVSGRGDLTAMARKLFDKVDTHVEGREAFMWQPSRMGAYPCVPEAISGVPDCMRRRVMVEDDRAPVRMFLSMMVSASIDEPTMARRGAALAAIAHRLSAERPVELYAVYDMEYWNADSTVDIVRVPTSPIDEQTVAWLFGAAESSRRLGFALGALQAGQKALGGSIKWLLGSTPNRDDYKAALRQVVDAQPSDIVIGGGYATEHQQMVDDPLGWAERYLAGQRELREAA
jgi:hypothetical protein